MQIVEYDEIREKLDEVKTSCNFLPDVTTEEGYEKSKRVALDVGKLLTALEKKRKDKKAYFLEGGKQVDSQAKTIAAELEQYQLPHKSAYKELDNLKKEREANRKAELERRVQEMRDLPGVMSDSDSAGVKMAMEAMQAEECLDFYEYSMQALEARNAARTALGVMFASKLKSEAEAVELEKLRADKAKRDQEAHEENIRREASAKAEQEAAAAKDREEQAKKELIMAKEEAAIAAENARLAEVARQAEARRIEDEAQAAREADKANISKVRGDIKTALMTLYGLDEDKAKQITLGLCRGDIPHSTVKY